MSKVYHNVDGSLKPLTETSFVTEDAMEKFVMNNLEVLMGEEIEPDDPRRWVVIKNQLTLTSNPTKSSYFVDLVLTDQDSILTLVEFKKETNSQLMREVIGQTIEYAANCIENWSADYIREQFEKEVYKKDSHSNPKEILFSIFAGDFEKSNEKYLAYWDLLHTNIKDKKVRILIVTEKMPLNLMNMISLLNDDCVNIEILGIELHPYSKNRKDEIDFFSPNLIGLKVNRKLKTGFRYTKESFLEEYQKQNDERRLGFMSNILDWIDVNGPNFRYRFDLNNRTSFYLYYQSEKAKHEFCRFTMDGKVNFYSILGKFNDSDKAEFISKITQLFSEYRWGKNNSYLEISLDNFEKVIELFLFVRSLLGS